MPQAVTPNPTTDHRLETPPERPRDLFAMISDIGSTTAGPQARAQALADAIRGEFNAVAVHVTAAHSGQEFDATSLAEEARPEDWQPVLRPIALEANAHAARIARVYAGADGEPTLALVGAPMAVGMSDPFGGVAIACPCRNRDDAEHALATLRAACAQAGAVILASPPPSSGGTLQYDDLARVFSKAGEYENLTRFAFAITNALRTRLGCDLAALATVEHGRVRVRCVSGLDEIRQRGPGVDRVKQAMGECADRCTPVVSQPGDQWGVASAGITAALHDRWRAGTANACVATVPILSGDRVTAVLALQRPERRPFTTGEIETARRLVAPLAGAIPLVAEATRPTLSRARRQLAGGLRWLVKPGSWVGKAALVGVIALIALFTFSTSTYNVAIPAIVVADAQHAIATPYDGRIERVHVTAGQVLAEGDPIATMDTAAIRLELTGVQADLDRAAAAMRASAAQSDPAAAAVSAAEVVAFEAQRDLLTRRIEQAVIRAPFAGIVIADKPEQHAGRFVRTGEPLMTLADASRFAIEVLADDAHLAHLRTGAPVRFASHARPEHAGRTTLGEIANAATDRAGAPVFVADAPLPAGQSWLVPGMEGVALVDAGEKPVWWIATHKILDTARLNFWID